jgi:hypothetical protein
MPTDHEFSLHSPTQSRNLEYGKEFPGLVNVTKKDIFPPPAYFPTRNGAPPQSSSTKTQKDKTRKSSMAAKALAASEKKLASEAKKLAVKGLQEKK